MKALFTISLSLLLVSCFVKKSEEIEQLNKPINKLEERVDSLVIDKNSRIKDPVGENDRCCAKTKKGTRCRLQAKKNSAYCWQHIK